MSKLDLEDVIKSAKDKVSEFRQRPDAQPKEFFDALEQVISLACDVYKTHSSQGIDHGFGIIFGYTRDMDKYFVQMGKNHFSEKPVSIYDSHSKVLPILSEAAKQDGVILIKPNGEITNSGMLIHDINHEEVLKILGKEYNNNLEESYGGLPPGTHFGSKNTTIRALSALLPDTVGITVNGYLRLFKKGDVSFSATFKKPVSFLQKMINCYGAIKNRYAEGRFALNKIASSDIHTEYNNISTLNEWSVGKRYV